MKPFIYLWLFIATSVAMVRASKRIYSPQTPLTYCIVWVNDDQTILLNTTSREKAITYYNDYKDHHSMMLWVLSDGLEVAMGEDMFKHLK